MLPSSSCFLLVDLECPVPCFFRQVTPWNCAPRSHYCIKPRAGRHVLPGSAHFLLALLCKNEYRGAGKNVWFVTLGKPSVRGRSGHGGEG
jgi:hypothetical protein